MEKECDGSTVPPSMHSSEEYLLQGHYCQPVSIQRGDLVGSSESPSRSRVFRYIRLS